MKYKLFYSEYHVESSKFSQIAIGLFPKTFLNKNAEALKKFESLFETTPIHIFKQLLVIGHAYVEQQSMVTEKQSAEKSKKKVEKKIEKLVQKPDVETFSRIEVQVEETTQEELPQLEPIRKLRKRKCKSQSKATTPKKAKKSFIVKEQPDEVKEFVVRKIINERVDEDGVKEFKENWFLT